MQVYDEPTMGKASGGPQTCHIDGIQLLVKCEGSLCVQLWVLLCTYCI